MGEPEKPALEIDWQSSTRTLQVKGVFDGRALLYVRSCFSAPALRPQILDLSEVHSVDETALSQLARELLTLDDAVEIRGLSPKHLEVLSKCVGDAADPWVRKKPKRR
jgi:hypothetical protein